MNRSQLHSRAWLGVVVALAAAAGYAVANTSASLAYQGGSNPLTVAATRFLVPTIALIVWLRLSGVSLVLPKRDTLLAVVLGFIVVTAWTAFDGAQRNADSEASDVAIATPALGPSFGMAPAGT